jgi:stage II sporulation protein D
MPAIVGNAPSALREGGRGDGSEALTRELTLAQFRALLRPQGLPGAFFRLVIEPERLVVEGAGLGHGVGLCQYGAQGMALQGHSYEEILKHYYTGIDVGTRETAVVSR